MQRDIVVIGGSFGSTAVLKHILGSLPPDLPAAILVATHISSRSVSHLPEALKRATALPVHQAVDGQPVEPGRVYIAPPDRHLLLLNGTILLGTGPRENMARPAIDPLFRSAALAYGPRVVGLILTGLLNDGAAGLHAIKAVGGVAMVQHPLDAEADGMPRAALEAVEVDHVGRVAELPRLLTAMVGTDAAPAVPASPELELEVAIAAGQRLGSDQLRKIGEPTALTCPHCQGVLSEIKGSGPLRYRCQIGDAFTAEAAMAAKDTTVSDAVRIAMRLMEERTELVTRMARDARDGGRTAVAELYEARAVEYAGYADTLRRAATLELRAARGAEPEAS
ncbi:chemotaxis protein CheB [Roseomonas hellenica]|uniref:protein-glutamate methylesterase n=1 Tax=Plastoroseomonas hellenica TaxID=2687306 RepID=A0ABS5EZ02_9PROT|nr:chemotaxis protein CheB [Plastoroseomonas hellenica]MBR0665540.1 chemotaxis protein CheB [Plastoroseomonas hellenica]